MTSALNAALMRVPKRAEAAERARLIDTFVEVGPLLPLLHGVDHQAIFGRRGTGKTHVLNYLADRKEQAGDAVAVVDLRSIGSNGGMYADTSIPLAARATRLLVDTLFAIHDHLYEFFVSDPEGLDLSRSGPALDRLAEAMTEVRVVGSVEHDRFIEQGDRKADRRGISGAGSTSGIGANAEIVRDQEQSTTQGEATRHSGVEMLYVNFGRVGAAFREIVDCLHGRRLWILLDEWSSVPMILQPYLADLLRRSLFPLNRISVKIAAIEDRSSFRIWSKEREPIGIELGADASADVNLDDFMVFDNDASRSQEFFENLLAGHIAAASREAGASAEVPTNNRGIINSTFTEKRAREEFVRSCEGVPRDAINIAALAAQKADDAPISVDHVRIAAKNWYRRDKERAVTSNDQAVRLLRWIIDQVIGARKARAFLLLSDARDELMEMLYDSRVLHVLKKGVSTNDQPGVRYDVYKLDYGCYVDLISTASAPRGLLPAEETDGGFVEVPPDDYRSIRRAILNLGEFYESEESVDVRPS